MAKEEKIEEQVMEKTIVNLEDFFTEDNEREGVWATPDIPEVFCPFRFLLTGANDPKNSANAERYAKKLQTLEDIKDPEEKAEKRKVLDAERIADFIIGLEPIEGYQINLGGKEFHYSKPMVINFLKKSPLIQTWIFNFVYKTTNFMKGKKISSN